MPGVSSPRSSSLLFLSLSDETFGILVLFKLGCKTPPTPLRILPCCLARPNRGSRAGGMGVGVECLKGLETSKKKNGKKKKRENCRGEFSLIWKSDSARRKYMADFRFVPPPPLAPYPPPPASGLACQLINMHQLITP